MEERCSPRQIGVLVFVALLAPASALPTLVAQGGPLGWLAPVVAMPIAALAAVWLRRLGPDGLQSRLRGFWGKIVLILYYIWALALSALTAGSCVDRLSRTDYLDAPNWLLALALTAVAAYLVRRGRGAFLRAVEVFYLALLAVLALFFVLGAANLDPENLRPAGTGDLSGAFTPLIPTLSTLSVGALAAFLPRTEPDPPASPPSHRVITTLSPPFHHPATPDAPPPSPSCRPPVAHPSPVRWLVGWCGAAAGLCLLTLGSLGPQLTVRAPLPFFLALQGVGVQGGFQRLEALGTAAWVLSDLALLGLAALSAQAITTPCDSRHPTNAHPTLDSQHPRNVQGVPADRRWALLPPLLAALLGGSFLGNGTVAPYTAVLFGVNLALGGLLPPLLSLRKGYLVGKVGS